MCNSIFFQSWEISLSRSTNIFYYISTFNYFYSFIPYRLNFIIKDIIAEDGNDAFIEIENRINAKLSVDNSVIATGGSVIYGKEAMEHLKEIGTVVYLRAGLDTIKSRLTNLLGRGVAMKKGQSLESLYKERTPLYEHYSDVIIDMDGATIEETVKKIAKILKK